jgi:thiol-disulfide isomerase/thioredoxin
MSLKLKLAIIPAAILSFVGVMGGTHCCPLCATLVDAVTGRSTACAAISFTDVSVTDATLLADGGVHAIKVKDLDDKEITLGELAKGKPMLIDIWATWCAPCRSYRKTLHSVHESVKDKVSMVAMSVDANGRHAVKKFLESNDSLGVEMIASPDFNAAVNKVNAKNSIPKTVLVDSKGSIVKVLVGALDADQVKREIAALK